MGMLQAAEAVEARSWNMSTMILGLIGYCTLGLAQLPCLEVTCCTLTCLTC